MNMKRSKTKESGKRKMNERQLLLLLHCMQTAKALCKFLNHKMREKKKEKRKTGEKINNK